MTDSSESPLDDEHVTSDLEVDLSALIAAWEDRGLSRSESARFLAVFANYELLSLGCSLGQVVDAAARQWEECHGRL